MMLNLLLLTAPALPLLSPVFGDHMVLQRDKPNTFWGWAAPGSKVRVTVANRKAEGTAGPDGKWTARLTPPKVGGPYTVVVEGPSRVELQDVLVGDVWLCTGQSNMEMGLSMAANGPAEVDAANEPNIRLAMAPRQVSYTPAPINPLAWKVCTPQNVGQGGWGGFSAVGYYFGRELQRKLKVPIGLVQVAWGGTSAEAWTTAEGLRTVKDFDADLARLDLLHKTHAPVLGTYTDLWLAENDPGTREHWEAPNAADESWAPATVPGRLDERGVHWFRRTLDVPAAGPATLTLGRINETDSVWINGHLIGITSFDWAYRRYAIPEGVLRPGRNVIAIRMFNSRARGGFMDKAEEITLEVGGEKIPVAGTWKWRHSLDSRTAATHPKDTEPNPSVPSVLANGMIAPVAPLAIRGAIWYQGETNSGRGFQYRRVLPALIGDWRRMFGQGDFPFYIVSLANFMARRPEPGDDHWAELREAQALTAAKVPHAGLAITIDVGDANDVHPKDKKTVGERLALNALAKEYGQKVEFSGPTVASMRREGSAIRVTFDHAEGGLIAKGDRLGEFSVAGADRKWHWAEARIEGDSVIIESPEVPDPIAVRYAWQSNPLATLYNKAGLPAVPFRTDDFPMVSASNK